MSQLIKIDPTHLTKEEQDMIEEEIFKHLNEGIKVDRIVYLVPKVVDVSNPKVWVRVYANLNGVKLKKTYNALKMLSKIRHVRKWDNYGKN